MSSVPSALSVLSAQRQYTLYKATAAGSSMKECRRQNFVLLNLRLPFKFEAVFLDGWIVCAVIDTTITYIICDATTNNTAYGYYLCGKHLANICLRLNIYLFHNACFLLRLDNICESLT